MLIAYSDKIYDFLETSDYNVIVNLYTKNTTAKEVADKADTTKLIAYLYNKLWKDSMIAEVRDMVKKRYRISTINNLILQDLIDNIYRGKVVDFNKYLITAEDDSYMEKMRFSPNKCGKEHYLKLYNVSKDININFPYVNFFDKTSELVMLLRKQGIYNVISILYILAKKFYLVSK